MADRNTSPIKTPKDNVQLLTAILQGAGAADMVNVEAGNMGKGEIASAVWTATGTFTLTFRYKYPELKAWCAPGIVGATAGLDARLTAIDVKAGTATLKCEVGAVATNPAAGDQIHFAWFVRNSGANR